MDPRPKTLIIDIDGTLVEHSRPDDAANPNIKMVLLEGTIKKLLEWERQGHRILLLTGRKESMRKVTEEQLSELGIFYDMLIMGVGGGGRYLINDNKPDGRLAAFAINVKRNGGISNITL